MNAAKPQAVSRETFNAVMVPNYSPMAVVPDRGEGARLWDTDGKEYLDFAAGIAVSAVGHCHPNVVAALTTQANKLWHVSNLFTNEPALRLAEKFCEATFAERLFFANSGAEANEAALKLARKYHSSQGREDKVEIIAFNQAFHGRTLLTVTAGGQPSYAEGFGPLPGGFTHLPFNDVEALEAQISDSTCAVFLEPIQGEGGVTAATPEFMVACRELCDKHGALLILDEVQCGNGRSGELFAYQYYGVTPDILSTAKGMGGGFPIGAMLTTAAIADCLVPGTHGSTYGGNPLACAVAEAVFDLIHAPEALENVKQRGEQLRAGLKRIGDKYGVFSEIRGVGLLLGAELSADFKGRARDILTACLDEGLLVLVAGTSVMRLAPSLLISEQEVEQGLARLEQAVSSLN